MVVNIPVAVETYQVNAGGSAEGLQVGLAVVLPNGSHLIKESRDGNQFKVFNEGRDGDNAYIAGPIPANTFGTIAFDVIAPASGNTPSTSVVVGANRGRGQLYPDGSWSNVNQVPMSASGVVIRINKDRKANGLALTSEARVKGNEVSHVVQHLPPGAGFFKSFRVGHWASRDAAFTSNPNRGGFGQSESELVVHGPYRLTDYIWVFTTITLAQA